MPSIVLDVPGDLWRAASKRATVEARDLHTVLLDLLARYADGRDASGIQSQGGRARVDGMTARQRRELAKKAAAARWGKRR